MNLTCFGFLFVFSCQTPEPPPISVVCPRVPAWTAPFQGQLADEFETAKPGGAARRALREYLLIRKQVKACRDRARR